MAKYSFIRPVSAVTATGAFLSLVPIGSGPTSAENKIGVADACAGSCRSNIDWTCIIGTYIREFACDADSCE